MLDKTTHWIIMFMWQLTTRNINSDAIFVSSLSWDYQEIYGIYAKIESKEQDLFAWLIIIFFPEHPYTVVFITHKTSNSPQVMGMLLFKIFAKIISKIFSKILRNTSKCKLGPTLCIFFSPRSTNLLRTSHTFWPTHSEPLSLFFRAI